MAKVTHHGSASQDDPIYSGGYEIFSRQGSNPSLKSTAKSTAEETQDESSSVKRTPVDPAIGAVRATEQRFGTDTKENKEEHRTYLQRTLGRVKNNPEAKAIVLQQIKDAGL